MKLEKYFFHILSKLYQARLNPKHKFGLVIGMLPWKNEVGKWIFAKDFVSVHPICGEKDKYQILLRGKVAHDD